MEIGSNLDVETGEFFISLGCVKELPCVTWSRQWYICYCSMSLTPLIVLIHIKCTFLSNDQYSIGNANFLNCRIVEYFHNPVT